MKRLVMTILVKNEADIIADNIRFHAAQGVDAFLVMDNGSVDGTVEILERMQKDFDITIVHESGHYQQAKWMTGLAKQARKDLQADWVISNDADEFWACKDGRSLKAFLNKESVVTVNRYNYILSAEQMASETPYYLTSHKVVSPILYNKQDQLKRAGLAMPLVKISPKTIVNPLGLMKIKGGNHRARHALFWRNREEPMIEVHHFPIRSFTQFENNIKNRAQLLLKDPATKMGDHYRRWVELLNKGELQEEFFRMSLTQDEIGVLQKVGVLACEQSPVYGFFNNGAV